MSRVGLWTALVLLAAPGLASGQRNQGFVDQKELPWPPVLAGGKSYVTAEGKELLKGPAPPAEGVAIARTAPRVEFHYYPGQDYPGNVWSNWGEGSAAAGKYFSAIGDHMAPAGTARVYVFDAEARTVRQLLDTKSLLKLPEGHYQPGKIHSRVDLAADGWLYGATHRGSTRVTTDQYHYRGDWIVRCHPETGEAEVVAHAPVPKHCIPASVTDPERMIFYGATTAGEGESNEHFFAYDLAGRKLLYAGPNGPSRAMILARSTGKLYFTPGSAGKQEGPLLRFDPAAPGEPRDTGLKLGLRAATNETAEGKVFAVSQGSGDSPSTLYLFDTAREKLEELGPVAVGSQQYVASIAVDPTGRYVYYAPGAHGGGFRDGSPLVQYDTHARRRKVICFLEPYFTERHGFTLKGTYSVACDPAGDRVYITWNVCRGTKNWDCAGLTVVEIPASERE